MRIPLLIPAILGLSTIAGCGEYYDPYCDLSAANIQSMRSGGGDLGKAMATYYAIQRMEYCP